MTDCMKKLKHLIVWRFEDAPAILRNLSTNGGDEDWLVEAPPGWIDHGYGMPFWMEQMDSMGDPKTYPHPKSKGWTVLIWSHS